MTLLQQEGEVVGPDAGHFVEEDQGTLEAVVDLFIFRPVPSRIEGRNVFDSEIEILFKEMTRQQTIKNFFIKKGRGPPSSKVCRTSAKFCRLSRK